LRGKRKINSTDEFHRYYPSKDKSTVIFYSSSRELLGKVTGFGKTFLPPIPQYHRKTRMKNP